MHSNKIIFIIQAKSFKNIKGTYIEKLNIVRYIQPENITIINKSVYIKNDGASIGTIDSFSVTLICRDQDEIMNGEHPGT